MNLKDFTKEDITPADLKRLGASEPQIYMHKDGKTIMVPKSKEQEYAKQGYQKSSLRAETKVNERMPASVIKHKERLAHMTDQELADRHGDTDEQRLRQMAWRHGYGKMSSHYVDRIRRAKQKVEGLQEDYSRVTKELITKLVKQGKTDDEIQQATGETGLRIRLIRKSVDYDKKEEAIKLAELTTKEWTTEELIERGEGIYQVNCVACHQTSGQGITGIFPALAGSDIVMNNKDKNIEILMEGVQGAAMNSFSYLSEVELAAVITYTRQSWGNAEKGDGEIVIPKDIVDYKEPKI